MSDYNNGYDEGYRAGMQKVREVGQARIEELEAELEKAVEVFRVIEDASRLYASDRESDMENVRYAHECTRRLCVATLAELKGETE